MITKSPPNLKINYKFMGANDSLIEEKEFQIDITENTDIEIFIYVIQKIVKILYLIIMIFGLMKKFCFF